MQAQKIKLLFRFHALGYHLHLQTVRHRDNRFDDGCIIGVGDAEALYRAFADGMRAAYGKVPTIGIPRFTRPQKRDGAIRSFSVVDPGGNWIRVASLKAGADDETRQSPLIRAIEAAMKVADGKGDPAQAAEVLDRALAKSADAAPADRIAALVYRAELALTLGDAEAARESLDAILGVEVTDADRSASQDDLERAEALRAKL